MTKASRGIKHGTRRKFKREMRDKFTVEKMIKEFKLRDKVVLGICPSSHTGFPPARYLGLVGEVEEIRGRSYMVAIMDGNKPKHLIVRPEHLTLHR